MRRLAAALPSRRRSVQAQALLAICSGSHASLCVRRCSRERGRGAPSPERGRRCGCRCRDNKLVRPSASPGALCVCTLWWHGGRLLCCAARRSPTAPTLCAAVTVGGGCEDVRFDRAPVWVYSGRQRADRNVREVLLGWRRPPARRVRTSHYRTHTQARSGKSKEAARPASRDKAVGAQAPARRQGGVPPSVLEIVDVDLADVPLLPADHPIETSIAEKRLAYRWLRRL